MPRCTLQSTDESLCRRRHAAVALTRPTVARIDRDALAHNLAVAQRLAGPARVLAVAKADAYGHGLDRLWPALRQAPGIAVLELDAAVRLRGLGYGGRLVLLEGFFEPDELDVIAQHGLEPVIHDEAQVAMLAGFRPTKPLSVLLKFNSGMNRLGFRADAFPQVLERLAGDARIGTITLMTHLAGADTGHGVDEQLARFAAVAAPTGRPVSIANSAALVRRADARGDWVRPGIMLFGGSPFADTSAAALGLRPVMTLRSRIIGVQVLAPGDAVGYGATFVADRTMRVGVVACGYADGYPRHAPTGTPIAVAGVLTRTLGRVSMDMLCVDLEPVPGAGVGSEVELWGQGVAVDDVAAAAGTIGYELLCGLARRVRVEVAGGDPSAGDAMQ